ncbi:MAG: zf-HC2 domain-containing protein [Lachnospiraceae bacterium]|nr:zf-HC2 domain-containing protein [Lachnospiraceae bacterium]
MKQIDCKIAEDLMPLFVENLLHPGSRKLFKEHLSSCSCCQEKLALYQREPFQVKKNEAKHSAPFRLRAFNALKDGYLWGIFILLMIAVTSVLKGFIQVSFPDFEKQMLFGIYAFALHGILFLVFGILCGVSKSKQKKGIFVLLFSIGFTIPGIFSESPFPWYLLLGSYPVILGGIIGHLILKLRSGK